MSRRRTLSNLPPPDSDFVGRAPALAMIAERFTAGRRLITLVGPGGIGKTRLAQEAARAQLPALAKPGKGGVWFCDLSAAHTLDDVFARLGDLFDVSLVASRRREDATEALGSRIADRGELLIVLDNVEQIVEVAAPALSRWMGLAPKARWLVTSRERLRVRGESVFEIEPLAVDSEAVALFEARLLDWEPDTVLSDGDRKAIAAIVRRIDGFPLAIELAVARCAVLGPSGLLARMDSQLDVLSRGFRGDAGRQNTLRGAIEWSWGLLNDTERRALASCAVFRGGFTAEAAEAVLELSGEPVLDVLHELRDKSLLRVLPSENLPGERRFGFYETIRAFAEEKRREQDDSELEARATDWFLSLGERLSGALYGEGGAEALGRLVDDRDNLLAVLQRALGASPSVESARSAVRCFLVLSRMLAMRSTPQRRVELSAEIDAFAAEVPNVWAALGPDMTARFLLGSGNALLHFGQVERGAETTERALALALENGERALEGLCRAQLGAMLISLERIGDAQAHLDEALQAAREAGDKRTEGIALGLASRLARRLSQYDRYEGYARRSLEIFREIGDARSMAVGLSELATLQSIRGQWAEASETYDEVLRVVSGLGDALLEVIGIFGRAKIDHLGGQYESARAHYTKAISRLETMAAPQVRASCQGHMGELLHALGDLEGAAEHYRAAIAVLRGERPSQALVLGVMLEAIEVERGNNARFEAVIADARKRLSDEPDRSFAAAIDIAEGFGGVSAGQLGAVEALVESAALDQPGVERPVEVRLVARVLARVLRAAKPDEAALLVAPEASAFQVPGEAVVAMGRRKAMRRIFGHLVHKRLEAPGAVSDAEALIAAGWPGESLDEHVALNRLHVALHGLRKLGLRAWVESEGEGWRLDPNKPVQWAPLLS